MGGSLLGRVPLPYGYVRAVRILLECILVINVRLSDKKLSKNVIVTCKSIT